MPRGLGRLLRLVQSAEGIASALRLLPPPQRVSSVRSIPSVTGVGRWMCMRRHKPHKFEAAGVGFLIETNIKGATDALPKDPIATINRLIDGAE